MSSGREKELFCVWVPFRTRFSFAGRVRMFGRELETSSVHGDWLVDYLYIGFGAFLGANARYLVGGWAAQRLGAVFPYGTLIINVSGSFLLGLLMALITSRFSASPAWRLFFGIGFLGGYTTFSTFTYESLLLIQERAYVAAAGNLLGSVFLGVIAAAVGMAVGSIF